MDNELQIQKQNTNSLATTSSPGNLLRLAVEKSADIVQLQALMDLQERWEKKEARKSFFDALSKFQTMVPELKKTKTANIKSNNGGAFSYKYSDLGAISKTIKNVLQECGLSYRWEFQENGDKIKCTCLLSHRDGHTETTCMESTKDNSGAKNNIQQIGSTQTYLQRYTLIGALGLATADEDNDAKNGSEPEKKQTQTEDEILDQWRQLVNGTSKQTELTNMYLKNKKAVDKSEKVKAIFKKRESELKGTQNKTELP